MNKDPFKEYLRETEPGKREKAYAWHTAIGLQAVDGLEPSSYLIDIAIKNIEGDITMDEAEELINRYYEEKSGVKADIGDKKRTLNLEKRTLKVCFKRMKA